MKKLTSLLLCMVLVLSMFCVNAAAAEATCMEAGVTVRHICFCQYAQRHPILRLHRQYSF